LGKIWFDLGKIWFDLGKIWFDLGKIEAKFEQKRLDVGKFD